MKKTFKKEDISKERFVAFDTKERKFVSFDSVPYGDEYNGGVYLEPKLVDEIDDLHHIFFSAYDLRKAMEKSCLISFMDELSLTKYKIIPYTLKTQTTKIYEYHPC